MAQDTHIIDLRRSFVPIDPNAFPVTMMATGGEDNPEPRVPVIPYAGHNFMPTPQGYASFFGTNQKLGIDSLLASGSSGNIDDIFMIQTVAYENILVALTDDGIWTKSSLSSGFWTHVIVLDVPATGIHRQWSKCVINNDIFVYRQNEDNHWKATRDNSYLFTEETPVFLNMAGQLGIFKAGGRLGYWDSENSISWSSLDDTADFTPDVETLAGNTTFQDIVGRIVNVLQNGTGFVIYATKSIVQVSRNTASPMLWQGKSLFNNNGISYRNEVTLGEPDSTHIASTTDGLVQISGSATVTGTVNVDAQFIDPEVATYFKESKEPFYLKLLNGRYLCFQMLDANYMTGAVEFDTEHIPANTLTFKGASIAIDGFTVETGACRALLAAQAVFDQYYLYNLP